ncbi:uncharacterized protein LOC135493792 [Lineus longissimus]|uniref:uncharacterized protein LOC135493792 n=1 Tax=Lineus longissimus TaxID=88925 RepID=UPI00315DF410
MVRVVVPQGEPNGDPHSRGASEINDDEDLGIYDDMDDGSSMTGHETDREADLTEGELDAKSAATFTTTRTESAVKKKVISVSIKDKDDKNDDNAEKNDDLDSLRAAEVSQKSVPKRSGILKKDTRELDYDGHQESQSLMFSNIDTNEHNASVSDIYGSSSGLRGKANTPASMYTEWTELRDLDSRLANESRDAMYKKAVNLMMTRCDTSQQNRSGPTPLLCVSNPPFGSPYPRYFYVHQEKPTPMPPLKAWRGYHGNVYFEPIQVNQAKVENPPEPMQPKVHSDTMSRIMMSRLSHQSNRSGNRSTSSQSASPQVLKYRKMAILDKNSVIERENPHLHEDIEWIRGQESVGSLRVEQAKKKRVSFSREKIMKGSVARSMTGGGVGRTLLSVSGVKSASPPRTPQGPASLLRSQTQYSRSPRRLTTNTPDGSLPPLDELRVRLRHVNTNKDTIVHIIPPVQRRKYEEATLKPFIKYSRGLKSGQNSEKSVKS